MIALALDTAGADCAACLIDGKTGTILSEKCEAIGKGHAERLMGMIEEVMADAGKAYRELDRIICAVGPGSFAGIRVGVATAKGLALGLNIEAVGVSNLDAVMAAAKSKLPADSRICAALNAGRNGAYCLFNFDNELAEANVPLLLGASEVQRMSVLSQFHIAGDAARSVVESDTIKATQVDINDVSLISTIAMIGIDLDPTAASPRPLYLRQPDAKISTGFAVKLVF